MKTVTISVERLVSEGDYCNYRVNCTVSDEVGPGESIGLVRAALHAECREHIRAVVKARDLQLERKRLISLAQCHHEQAERDLAYAEENPGELFASNILEEGNKGLTKAKAAEQSAEAIDFDEDWLPF